MTTKYTQGPWSAKYTVLDNGESYWAIIGTPNGNEDHLPHKGALVGKITGVKDRQQANAELIALVPELVKVAEFYANPENFIFMDGKFYEFSDRNHDLTQFVPMGTYAAKVRGQA